MHTHQEGWWGICQGLKGELLGAAWKRSWTLSVTWRKQCPGWVTAAAVAEHSQHLPQL